MKESQNLKKDNGSEVRFRCNNILTFFNLGFEEGFSSNRSIKLTRKEHKNNSMKWFQIMYKLDMALATVMPMKVQSLIVFKPNWKANWAPHESYGLQNTNCELCQVMCYNITLSGLTYLETFLII